MLAVPAPRPEGAGGDFPTGVPAGTLPGALAPPTLAILIPVLDEEESLCLHLPAIVAVADEVVVADGGSRDRSAEVAESLGARVVASAPGRGRQLNRAAAASGADLFLFLHADTALPPGAAEAVRQAIAGGACGGAFYLRFASERRLLRLGAWLINLRTRLTRAPLGDQAQFVTREAFAALGGFREWPVLEDLDFVRRLKRHGRIVLLPGPVVTSARRFETAGVPRTIATNWLIWSLYLVGVSPERLGRLYKNIR